MFKRFLCWLGRHDFPPPVQLPFRVQIDHADGTSEVLDCIPKDSPFTITAVAVQPCKVCGQWPTRQL